MSDNSFDCMFIGLYHIHSSTWLVGVIAVRFLNIIMTNTLAGLMINVHLNNRNILVITIKSRHFSFILCRSAWIGGQVLHFDGSTLDEAALSISISIILWTIFSWYFVIKIIFCCSYQSIKENAGTISDERKTLFFHFCLIRKTVGVVRWKFELKTFFSAYQLHL